MKRNCLCIFGLMSLIFFAGALTNASAQEVKKAIAVLHPTSNSQVTGTVTFTKMDDAIQIVADVNGLAPGKHGFHVHEFGDCSAPDATSAGSHFNPTHKPHGGPEMKERHIGDLGNLEADAAGKAHLELKDKMVKLGGPTSIVGYAVIVHEKEDDLKSQPVGNAGGRVACGVVGVAKP
jgi:Cu-Zn family superoxide dismutase